MRLHYNILWIDNDLPEYEERGALDDLRAFLSDLGFKAEITPLYGETGLDKVLEETRFDLIISDYELGNTTGITVVDSIRDKYLTEILFYTAKTAEHSEAELRESLKHVDRITIHLGRETLIETIERIIRLTVDKLIELNATRGLITSETSQLDVLIEDLVIDLVKNRLKLPEEETKKIIDSYATDFLAESSTKFIERFTKIGFENIFQSIEANRKWKIFRGLLKQLIKTSPSDDISKFLTNNSTYFDQVIDIRNKFAHAKAMEKDGKTVLRGQYGKDDFEFDSDQCISIRKNLISHRDNFNLLLVHFGMEVK